MSTNKKEVPKWAHFVAGGIGGGVGVTCTLPLEVVKTRLQAQNFKGVLTAGKDLGQFRLGTGIALSLHQILRSDGVRGLWAGLTPSLVGVVPARAIWFTSYEISKKFFATSEGVSSSGTAISGIIAGVTVTTLTCPIWVVKTRLQLQSSLTANVEYKSSIDCFRKIYKHEGPGAFYKGLGASYLGIVESSLQLVMYEGMKKTMQINKQKSDPEAELNPWEIFQVSSIAKLVAAAVAYPHEVIRTRLREQRGSHGKYPGVWGGMRVILVEEGLRGLYGGMCAHLLRVVPNAGIMFLTYETVLSFVAPKS